MDATGSTVSRLDSPVNFFVVFIKLCLKIYLFNVTAFFEVAGFRIGSVGPWWESVKRICHTKFKLHWLALAVVDAV